MNMQSPHVALRAALYLRVSTTRQAEHDVSIPDQRKQGEAYCVSRGYQLVETFVEAGASATNDRRPEFQRMIEAGTSKPAPFDVVVVHSFSRFFRDHFELEFNVRKLAKNGVKLVSITQEMGDDPMHVMMRQIMALFDEYQSKENGKHVMRALKENARQGFWNGSLPPIGYRVVDAEQRGAKMKKKLEIDPLHADTVRLIFRLASEGDGTSGPMGVKNIVNHLNKHRMFTRNGGRWGIGQLHRVLTRRTYIGEHRFNRRSNKGVVKPEEEIVTVAVPPLIDLEIFEAVQNRLKVNNPKVTPPRVVSGPNLLTGICHCGNCGGAMTLRTGKNGRYRYYACSIRARQGDTGCKGRAIPMDKLDRMVVTHIEERLLDPERIEDVLASLLDRRQEGVERRSQHIAELNHRAAEADNRLKRLYDAIEAGSLDPAESSLGERIAGLTALRDQARADATRIEAMLASSTHQRLTGAAVRELASEARTRLRLGKGGYRREHVRAFAQHVEVADDAIYIKGSKNVLLRTLVAAKGGKSAGIGVPGFVPKWRSGRDSNPRYAFDVYSLSRRAPSTTRPPLRMSWKATPYIQAVHRASGVCTGGARSGDDVIAQHEARNADLFGPGLDMLERQRRAGALGQEDLAALRDILAQLARQVHLVAENILVVDVEHLPIADADRRIELAFLGQHHVGGVQLTHDAARGAHRVVGIIEQAIEIVGLGLDQQPAMILDLGQREALHLVHHQQEGGDAMALGGARKAAHVEHHDRAGFPEHLVDAFGDRWQVFRLFNHLVEQPVERGAAIAQCQRRVVVFLVCPRHAHPPRYAPAACTADGGFASRCAMLASAP